MTTYIYPQNLRAKANLWLWSLRDFLIIHGHCRFAFGCDFGADAHFPSRGGDLALRFSQHQT